MCSLWKSLNYVCVCTDVAVGQYPPRGYKVTLSRLPLSVLDLSNTGGVAGVAAVSVGHLGLSTPTHEPVYHDSQTPYFWH